MNLKRHLAFVQDMLYSRRDITIEELLIEETEPEQAGIVEGRLRYWDGSLFKFVEQLTGGNWGYFEDMRHHEDTQQRTTRV